MQLTVAAPTVLRLEIEMYDLAIFYYSVVPLNRQFKMKIDLNLESPANFPAPINNWLHIEQLH